MYGTILFLYHPFETATLLLHASSDEFKCTAQKFDQANLCQELFFNSQTLLHIQFRHKILTCCQFVSKLSCLKELRLNLND